MLGSRFDMTLQYDILPGEIFGLAAVLLWGTAPILVRRGLAYTSARVGILYGLLASLPLVMFVIVTHPFELTEVLNGEALLWFTAAGISGPGLGRMFNYVSVARLGAAKSTSLVNTAPLFTAFFAVVFLAERLTLTIFIGVFSIVVGVLTLTSRHRPSEKRLS